VRTAQATGWRVEDRLKINNHSGNWVVLILFLFCVVVLVERIKIGQRGVGRQVVQVMSWSEARWRHREWNIEEVNRRGGKRRASAVSYPKRECE